MRSPERDIQSIRLMGGLILGVGLVQLLLTFVVTLFGLFGDVSSGTAGFTRGALAAALSLLMASVMSSCGIQLQRLRFYSQAGMQSVRLVWTALVLVMALGGIAAIWLEPPLTSLAALTLLGLFAIRPAILRLIG